MNKQPKLKQQKKSTKKEIVNFQQRFKDKKSVVSKLGLFDLLGYQQPFDLNREIVNSDFQPINMFEQRAKNPQNQLIQKKRFSESHLQNKMKNNQKQLRTNKTQNIKGENRKGIGSKQKFGLPRILKSSANIMLHIDNKQKLTTKQYWRGKEVANKAGRANKGRSVSQLSCLSMLKLDSEANLHWQNLARFQKMSKGGNKKKISLVKNI